MPVTVCPNMIVKNEAHVIRRCLDSVRPFIDADETLRAAGNFAWTALGADADYLHAAYGSAIYSRCALVSTRLAWRSGSGRCTNT